MQHQLVELILLKWPLLNRASIEGLYYHHSVSVKLKDYATWQMLFTEEYGHLLDVTVAVASHLGLTLVACYLLHTSTMHTALGALTWHVFATAVALPTPGVAVKLHSMMPACHRVRLFIVDDVVNEMTWFERQCAIKRQRGGATVHLLRLIKLLVVARVLCDLFEPCQLRFPITDGECAVERCWHRASASGILPLNLAQVVSLKRVVLTRQWFTGILGTESHSVRCWLTGFRIFSLENGCYPGLECLMISSERQQLGLSLQLLLAAKLTTWILPRATARCGQHTRRCG